MKTSTLTVVASILSLAGTGFAEEAPTPKQPRQVPPEIAAKFDKDGDGKLNKEEKQTMRKEMNKKALEHFDHNRDGTLDEDEKAKMREAIRMLHGKGPGKLGKELEVPGAGL